MKLLIDAPAESDLSWPISRLGSLGGSVCEKSGKKGVRDRCVMSGCECHGRGLKTTLRKELEGSIRKERGMINFVSSSLFASSYHLRILHALAPLGVRVDRRLFGGHTFGWPSSLFLLLYLLAVGADGNRVVMVVVIIGSGASISKGSVGLGGVHVFLVLGFRGSGSHGLVITAPAQRPPFFSIVERNEIGLFFDFVLPKWMVTG